jgi:PAS domain S-box-containing protein
VSLTVLAVLAALALAAGLIAFAVLRLGRPRRGELTAAEARIQALAAALEQAEARVHDSSDLLTFGNDLFFSLDDEGRMRDGSAQWAKLLGYADDALRTLGLRELVRPDLLPSWDRTIAAVRGGERVARFETVLLARQGWEVQVQGTLWPQTREGRTRVRGVLVDVTRQRLAERELARNEERFRNLFARAPYPLWVYDQESLRILEANETASAVYGYTRKELLELKVNYLSPPEEVPWPDLMASHGEERFTFVCRHRLRDGRVIDVEVTSHRIEHEGREARLVFARDITEQLRTQAALLESEERYRELFENGQGLVCTHDLEGRLLAINPAACRELGYPAEELVGRSLRDALVPSAKPLFDDYLAGVRNRREGAGLMKLLTATGEERVWMYRNSLFEKPGSTPFVLGHAIDVTERLRIEKALERSERKLRELLESSLDQNLELELRNRAAERANRLKSEFLAAVSHDLRTPLTTIIGFSDLLHEDEEGHLDERQRTYLGFVRQEARHLLQLINDLLDLSKIEAGRLDVHPEEVKLSETLPEALAAIEPLLASRRLLLEVDVPAEVSVYVDRVRFRQILSNLLSNALKFTPEGGRVSLAAATLGDLTSLTVSDNGIGIPAEEQEAVFSEFHQAGTSAGTRDGAGLGLAIVRRLVEQHGGKVWVESDPGVGSCFTLLLPADRRSAERLATVKEQAAREAGVVA